ncbi:N-6 DNA Methylase [Algoriphagus alkaliphilus]|uniref:site-specific DNA-methyltransferase (adenine-specific) n=1 Tax=Algoriphagus alkaliphilus TaxID=279824 RepID=A0A1G5ZK72_9BACT|nr:type ISP restriction/modification enzyme [Algoriphagus alkaliphilus]SDA95002.1 N-6 DNA Methylase [Algoriphagus alkaliphilus]
MTLDQYIDNINRRYTLGNATEHTFRGDLQQLLESLVPTIRATNEPKRQSCGAPDYILTKKDIPVGFIEAKDIGDKDLDGTKKTGNKEQFDRYKASLNNLLFTDYLSFHLYRDGEFITKISIGEITEKGIKPLTENFASFENLIKDFSSHVGQTIKSSKKLAEMMAGKARLLSDVIGKALTSDEINHEDSTLKDQMTAFKDILIHDITPQGFADVYAQTIAYGMFAARLHDPTLGTFSRQEAAELIPKSNPFLRKLFGYIAGPDIDDRIKWIVDSLTDIFLACNVEEILKNYGKSTKMEDPIIHFYETFLSEYDPKLRKARGVWYTPQPVVNFIVRAVDDILKTEFDLPQGLADTSKTKIKVDVQGKKVEQEVHKVQILDPATGTGTFLAEVVKHIHKKFQGQQGIWSNYVETHLLPRLNGFELLMASYAMAHLKLDLLLTETGYKPTTNQRFRVYLTNSLEEHHQDTGTLFANWLSTEANEANHIKRDTPVMCVIGNPPYSGESANKGEWIMKLMEDYKKEPGGKEKLKEQNSKFINDDYVKFLRYGQHFIEKNGSGVLAFINPHGFLDNPTFRGMRWHLLKTYDKIYTIDLHGNAKKKETAPDGSADVNVFDIEQGVSINFFIKTGKKKPNELGKVYHFDLYGKRDLKYDFLIENSLKSTPYNELKLSEPNFFFKMKDYEEENIYNKGFSIPELFPLNSLGLLTKRDNLAVDFNSKDLVTKIEYFLDENKTVEEVCKYYGLVVKDKDKWDATQTRANVPNSELKEQVRDFQYRPFDNRKVFYNPYFVARPNTKVLGHFIKENVGLIICRQGQAVGGEEWNVVFTCKYLADQNIYRRGGGTIFPLYLYPDNSGQQIIEQTTERQPNLNAEIVNQLALKIGLTFTNEKQNTENTFAPVDIVDYIYAVLHSPTYREKYKEFLKTDFPKIPYPQNADTFWQLVKLGGEIRQIHLLESSVVENYITQYPIDGDNVVGKTKYENGKVYINETQYFDNVPQIAWEFYIGGYQPAQKWLKDRKDRKLEFDDILHYQKIIVALSETDRLMKEIDKIEI